MANCLIVYQKLELADSACSPMLYPRNLRIAARAIYAGRSRRAAARSGNTLATLAVR
jgi:hypothetical protein